MHVWIQAVCPESMVLTLGGSHIYYHIRILLRNVKIMLPIPAPRFPIHLTGWSASLEVLIFSRCCSTWSSHILLKGDYFDWEENTSANAQINKESILDSEQARLRIKTTLMTPSIWKIHRSWNLEIPKWKLCTDARMSLWKITEKITGSNFYRRDKIKVIPQTATGQHSFYICWT